MLSRDQLTRYMKAMPMKGDRLFQQGIGDGDEQDIT